MSASATSMYEFIETARHRMPRRLHPCGDQAIHEYFSEMREAVDDPPRVLELIRRACNRVAQELRWEAENAETFPTPINLRHSHRLRRLADKYEAAAP
jgi:hypothetical protein